jgi:hypothetical protein
VPISKVSIYAMGKVAMYPQEELRQLQQLKQKARKEFDKNPENERRLNQIKKLRHNYERSQSMFVAIQQVGLTNSAEDINKIISHLLDIGELVNLETKANYPSEIEASRGRLRTLSTWVILPDETKYLSTIKLVPMLGA